MHKTTRGVYSSADAHASKEHTAAVISPVSVWLTWIMLIFVPLIYFVPRVLEGAGELEEA